MTPGILLDDLPGPIGGVVLTDQDFVIEVSFLCQGAVKRLPYESLMVIRHDQNSHALAMAACDETQLSSPSFDLDNRNDRLRWQDSAKLLSGNVF